MDIKDQNYLIRILKQLFDIYSLYNDCSSKLLIIKMFYEKKVIDIKNFDIFSLNEILFKLNIKENSDLITFKDFLNLILIIYECQNINFLPENIDNVKSKFEKEPINERIDKLSCIIDDEKEILEKENSDLSLFENKDKANEYLKNSNPNIIRNFLLYEKNLFDNNADINKFNFKYNKTILSEIPDNQNTNTTDLILCFPDISNETISEVLNNIYLLSIFKDKLYNIFIDKCKKDEYNEIEYIEFYELIQIIYDKNIFNNFPSIRIADIISKFMNPFKFNSLHEDFKIIFDDISMYKDKNKIQSQLCKFNLDINDLKFNFSSFVLIITIFHKYLKNNLYNNNYETNINSSICYYYKVVLEFDGPDYSYYNLYNEEKKQISLYYIKHPLYIYLENIDNIKEIKLNNKIYNLENVNLIKEESTNFNAQNKYFKNIKNNEQIKKILNFSCDNENNNNKDQDYKKSKYLKSAIDLENTLDNNNKENILEFVVTLDKELPKVSLIDTDININKKYPGFINEKGNTAFVSNYNKTLFYNKESKKSVDNNLLSDINTNSKKLIQFPFNKNVTDLAEEEEKKQNEKDEKIILKSKKVEKNKKKEGPDLQLDYSKKITNKELYNKHYGSKHVNNLCNRYFKRSYKEILSNTFVYPTIIQECLLVPNKIPFEIKIIIRDALMSYYINNNIELALSMFETAKNECEQIYISINSNQTNNFNLKEEDFVQIDLYFNLIMGNLFVDLELYSQAFYFFSEAKVKTYSKFSGGNPDSALLFCFLGRLFLRINEPEIAIRCYWKAKLIREKIIGGDSLDCATVYNNLGVCFYYLKSYYEAHAFFKLAYEIYKDYE